MPVVSSDVAAALFTNFRVIFEDQFLAASSAAPYERYCTIIPSQTETESYNWFGTVPAMAEWIDTARYDGLYDFTYSLTNVDYQTGISVDRNTLKDDKYNMIKPRVQQLAMEAARYPSFLAISALVNNGTCYDGDTFFSDTHGPEGEQASAQDNSISGDGTTLANVRADFLEARTAMARFQDDRGRPMNLQADLIVGPPNLQDQFEQLISTNTPGGSTTEALTNTLRGVADIIIDANLSDVDNWYVLHTKNPFKPLIFQQRQAPEFHQFDDATDKEQYDNREIAYSVDMRCVVGYGDWRMAVKVTNSG